MNALTLRKGSSRHENGYLFGADYNRPAGTEDATKNIDFSLDVLISLLCLIRQLRPADNQAQQ